MSSKPPSRTPLAGGVLIAIGAMGGAVIGQHYHEPIPGFLIGVGTGIALSLLIWLVDLRR
ncbi:MAG: hypothetical protein JWN66_2985 [Sphingomonas bacterium]|uniref:hypothetical protein n=1 Tax=Sphingomonas bacterium TaxID=1895847 RepID=UPI00262E9CB7|nr:hypothetical protein [Sphingomonas bacterium]MDB5705869.1 hypothetical protein [Sphingomonas bacterium]